jgi:LysM repeat protein
VELVRKNIHMDRIKGQATTQITLEDDVNISDSKPDVSKLIYDRGSVALEEVKATEDHVTIKGRLNFAVMYLPEGDNTIPCCMEGSIPFEEQVYMEGVQSGDNVKAKWDLEDMTIGLINSRKLSVQALVSFKFLLEAMCDEETAVDLYHEEPVEYRKKPLEILQMTVKKRDIFRIKEELELPQNYPNIFQIIWQGINVDNVEFRAGEGKLSVQGDLHAFFLYEGEGEENPVRAFATTVPFSGMIECSGCEEGMIGDIEYSIGHVEVEIRPDFDGEQRIFGVEVVLDLDIDIYEETRLDILSGVYGVVKEVEAVSRPAQFKGFLGRPAGKIKVSDRMKLQGSDTHMLQILHSDAQARIDNKEVVENGIHVKGVLNVQTLYLSSDSKVPYGFVKGVFPFSHVLEVPGINESSAYKVNAGIEQLSVAMIDSDELDVKAVVSFKGIAFDRKTEDIVTDVAVSELNMDKLNELPSIVIYVAKEGDSLWDVGKKYYVPISQIKETNEMATDDIKAGDKLLIVKGISK